MFDAIDGHGWAEIIGALFLGVLHVLNFWRSSMNRKQIARQTVAIEQVRQSVEGLNIEAIKAEMTTMHESLDRLNVLVHGERRAVRTNLETAQQHARRRISDQPDWPIKDT
jgi:uncharacterized membrane protein